MVINTISEMVTIRREPWIGGPNTILPRPIESLLCWSLALSCLSVSGYHYVVETFVKPFSLRFLNTILFRSIAFPTSSSGLEILKTKTINNFPCWLPLMTYSRAELERGTPRTRFEQLAHVLNRMSAPLMSKEQETVENTATTLSGCNNILTTPLLPDDMLVSLMRDNEILRRLASLALRPSDHSNNDLNSCSMQPLGQQLIRIWPRLLALPPIHNLDGMQHDYNIALIMPCYHEKSTDIVQKLNFALSNCHNAENVQVLIIVAGEHAAIDKQHLLESFRNNNDNDVNQWGEVKIVEFVEESGRGPCLNFGAAQSNASIYAFCHSDTRLPNHWDTKLIQTLYPPTQGQLPARRTNSCAYGFGIDTSPDGLLDGSCPPGIGAIEVTANLRCRLWSLPYGDQCLSLRAADFHYLGGFPHQCFMEDYELIALLRKRVRLLKEFQKKLEMNTVVEDEVLTIIPGPPALCSPRRWQKFGVFYVTYTNSKLVNLYAGGMTPDDLYRLYYGQGLAIQSPKSPWEIQLDQLLTSSTKE
jgi:hypothetical protein